MELITLFSDIYKNKKVWVSGHTGFKGSWLVLWLQSMGAEVYGFSLEPESEPNHYSLLSLCCKETIGDITDLKNVKQSIQDFQPDIIFHLAAQPLVRLSYQAPVETFKTNVIGTANVLEAARSVTSVKASVMITTDKCYENNEWLWGYREIDKLGGYDPYSASKACCEILISSFRNSFCKTEGMLIATCRAGNVIGGGDWAEDRLIPDLMKTTAVNQDAIIRSPNAIRPWQHVLESLSGYLLLGQKLLEGNRKFADAWNFGPIGNERVTVSDVLSYAVSKWDKIKVNIQPNNQLHEAGNLLLDCSKAIEQLNWRPVWDESKDAVLKTVEWYKAFYEDNEVISKKQLKEYINKAIDLGTIWTRE